jgi:hypothetical protein
MEISIEQRLHILACNINDAIGKGKGNNCVCSIFLYDHKQAAYVLRGTTKGSPYLGHATVDTSRSKQRLFYSDQPQVGLTAKAIFSKRTIISQGALMRNDPAFSCYGMSNKELNEYIRNKYLEFPAANIRSLIASPILFEFDKSESKKTIPAAGVIRVVRSTLHPDSFNEKNARKIESIIRKEVGWIRTSLFLSQLSEFSSYTDLPNLCEAAAIAFRDQLDAKGCSVFLLDDGYADEQQPHAKVYKCFGTTGLAKIVKMGKNEVVKPLNNPLKDKDAWYEINDPNDEATALTTACIQQRKCLFIDDVYIQNSINDALPVGSKVNRPKGRGKVSEYFVEGGAYRHSKSVLFAPMFYGAVSNNNIDVLGVVRVQGGENKKGFSPEQMHIFVSLARSLAQSVTSAKLVEFVDKLADIDDRERLFKYVVQGISKFIGSTDCALLICNGNKLRKLAEWQKDDGIKYTNELNEAFTYDLSNPTERGYSGFVAHYKHPLLFNNPDEIGDLEFVKDLKESERPQHHVLSGDAPHRYLGIPIISSFRETLAVLRVCASESEPLLSDDNRRILELIGRRLRPHLEELVRSEEKRNKAERIFPIVLQTKISSLKNWNCKHILKSFLNDLPSMDTIEGGILKLIPRIGDCYSSAKNGQWEILEGFCTFNSNIVKKMPSYRDHFIHQFVVYLLGAVIIESLEDVFFKAIDRGYRCSDAEKSDSSAHADAGRERIQKKYTRQEKELLWLWTSLFHDVAYPLHTANAWFKGVIDTFSGTQSTKDKRILLRIDDMLFNNEYLERIEILSEYHSKKYGDGQLRDARRKIIEVLRNSRESGIFDHGIMEAFTLLGDNRFGQDKIIHCASAIATHNKLLLQLDDGEVQFETHPLAFLLVFCDLIQEWGRSEESFALDLENVPMLEALQIFDAAENLREFGASDEEIIKMQGSGKCVLACLRVSSRYRISDLKECLRKLSSKDASFCIKVNEEFIPVRCRK